VKAERVALRLARLARSLRQSGVGVSLTDEIDAACAFTLVDATDAEELRRALRIALKVPRPAWETFDRLFESAFLGESEEPARPPSEARPPRTHGFERRGGCFPRWNAERAVIEDEASDEVEGETPGYSPAAVLRGKALPHCGPEDLAELERVLAQWARRLATQQSRRLVPASGSGFVDPRRSLRRAVRTAGEVVSLARRQRATLVPRLVFLCDTSGSMSPHARFLLAFALALKRVAARTEVFAFNTSLVRLTAWVRPAKLALTLERIAAEVPDWGGGTRIGECLSEFAEHHLGRVVDGRTVVVILSDGLDQGDPARVRDAMRRIKARARKVVWLNPLLRDPRYRPEAQGMEAALPFVDRLAPAHDAASLERLLPELGA
jgi:uncharacterized protein with von Willebrand factor type A (vWA) domain